MEAASVRKIKGCIATVKAFSGRPTTRMSLLLSWHPTLADVTQKGVLKLMNLDGLAVYHTNDHLQVHKLESFLRFVHTFRFVFQEKFGSYWPVIATICLNEYKNNAMSQSMREDCIFTSDSHWSFDSAMPPNADRHNCFLCLCRMAMRHRVIDVEAKAVCASRAILMRYTQPTIVAREN
ncbi:hypothetical protein TRIUR3_06734 [Triticum urartu]|uniref:Uncharacterized protein n=1 Tax=Triticum urartu TaxID=4572 RepID=M7YVY4_TRIUA|nr:hypothetical protein TRIUR3_06734 [Triticum urartu]